MVPKSGLSATASDRESGHVDDPASTAKLPVDIRRFPWIRRLVADYAFDYPKLADFYAGNPAEPEAWKDAVARTQVHARPREAK